MHTIARSSGHSQQTYAAWLGSHPSRFVTFVDEMERLRLIERRRGHADRRSYALHLTAHGQETVRCIRELARAHDDDICSALRPDERASLRELLIRVARQQPIVPGGHPGYRRTSAGPRSAR